MKRAVAGSSSKKDNKDDDAIKKSKEKLANIKTDKAKLDAKIKSTASSKAQTGAVELT